MFPAINMLPIIIGFGLPSMIGLYYSNKIWRRMLFPILVLSCLLNTFLVITIIFTPYSQTVNFANTLNHLFKDNPVNIHCVSRTPLETESHLPLVFYSNTSSIHYTKINSNHSLRQYTPAPEWLATTYNQMKDDKKMIDSLGYQPVAYSSHLLWNINRLLDSKKINTINDIWVLYKRK